MIFLAKMIRIVQEHLIKLPHCSGWCLNVLVINRMVFSPLPTRRMSAHNITSPITSGNCIRIYYEYVSSRILSTRKKRGDVAFVKYIFQGLSSWKGRAVSWRWFGVDQRKRLDSFPFPFIPPLTPPPWPPAPSPPPGWFIGPQQWRVMFWILGTNIYIFLLVRHFQRLQKN